MGPSIQYLGYIRSLNCLCTAWTILLNLYEDASVNSNPSPSSVPFLQRPATPQHGVIALAKACVEKTFGVLLEGCCAQWERATCHLWVALMLRPCQFSDLGSNPVIFSAQKWLWGWLAASCAAERGVFSRCPVRSWGTWLPSWPDSPGSCSTSVVCSTLLLTRGVTLAWFIKRDGMPEWSGCCQGNREKYSLWLLRSCWVLGYIFSSGFILPSRRLQLTLCSFPLSP